jgi:O-antigen/teichoic acid export membrane protein
MAAVAEPMIILLIGEKWRPSIVYLQMLSFVGMMYPLHSLNLNMLQVQGYSGLFLKIEIIKKILAIPTLVIGVFWGVKLMIAGMMINSLISYYLNSYWSGIKIGYSIKDQIKDILPSFAMSLFMAVFVFYIGLVLPFNLPENLIVQVLSGFIFVVFVGEIFKVNDYLYIKSILREKVRELRHSV